MTCGPIYSSRGGRFNAHILKESSQLPCLHHNREIQKHNYMRDLPEQAAQNLDMLDSPEPSAPLGERGARTTSSSAKTKKGSSTTVQRRKCSDEPNASTKIDGDRVRDEPKRERSTSKITSRQHGRRSSTSAIDEPNMLTKSDGNEPKRERSKSKRASQLRGRRRSSMSAVDETNISAKTADGDGDGTKRERSKTKISLQHRGRRSSASAVIDNTQEYQGFVVGGLAGARTDFVRERKSSTPFSRKRSTEAPSKHRSGSPDKHRSGSLSKQDTVYRTSKQDSSSSRSHSKRPSDSLDNRYVSSPGGVSPSKRESQSPRSTRTAKTQSSSSSRLQASPSKSFTPRSERQRKKSQDFIKRLVASIDINFADDFKIGESSASTAVKKSEKARQTRLALVDPMDSPVHQARRFASVYSTGSPGETAR
jgi:hypothetical protein